MSAIIHQLEYEISETEDGELPSTPLLTSPRNLQLHSEELSDRDLDVQRRPTSSSDFKKVSYHPDPRLEPSRSGRKTIYDRLSPDTKYLHLEAHSRTQVSYEDLNQWDPSSKNFKAKEVTSKQKKKISEPSLKKIHIKAPVIDFKGDEKSEWSHLRFNMNNKKDLDGERIAGNISLKEKTGKQRQEVDCVTQARVQARLKERKRLAQQCNVKNEQKINSMSLLKKRISEKVNLVLEPNDPSVSELVPDDKTSNRFLIEKGEKNVIVVIDRSPQRSPTDEEPLEVLEMKYKKLKLIDRIYKILSSLPTTEPRQYGKRTRSDESPSREKTPLWKRLKLSLKEHQSSQTNSGLGYEESSSERSADSIATPEVPQIVPTPDCPQLKTQSSACSTQLLQQYKAPIKKYYAEQCHEVRENEGNEHSADSSAPCEVPQIVPLPDRSKLTTQSSDCSTHLLQRDKASVKKYYADPSHEVSEKEVAVVNDSPSLASLLCKVAVGKGMEIHKTTVPMPGSVEDVKGTKKTTKQIDPRLEKRRNVQNYSLSDPRVRRQPTYCKADKLIPNVLSTQTSQGRVIETVKYVLHPITFEDKPENRPPVRGELDKEKAHSPKRRPKSHHKYPSNEERKYKSFIDLSKDVQKVNNEDENVPETKSSYDVREMAFTKSDPLSALASTTSGTTDNLPQKHDKCDTSDYRQHLKKVCSGRDDGNSPSTSAVGCGIASEDKKDGASSAGLQQSRSSAKFRRLVPVTDSFGKIIAWAFAHNKPNPAQKEEKENSSAKELAPCSASKKIGEMKDVSKESNLKTTGTHLGGSDERKAVKEEDEPVVIKVELKDKNESEIIEGGENDKTMKAANVIAAEKFVNTNAIDGSSTNLIKLCSTVKLEVKTEPIEPEPTANKETPTHISKEISVDNSVRAPRPLSLPDDTNKNKTVTAPGDESKSSILNVKSKNQTTASKVKVEKSKSSANKSKVVAQNYQSGSTEKIMVKNISNTALSKPATTLISASIDIFQDAALPIKAKRKHPPCKPETKPLKLAVAPVKKSGAEQVHGNLGKSIPESGKIYTEAMVTALKVSLPLSVIKKSPANANSLKQMETSTRKENHHPQKEIVEIEVSSTLKICEVSDTSEKQAKATNNEKVIGTPFQCDRSEMSQVEIAVSSNQIKESLINSTAAPDESFEPANATIGTIDSSYAQWEESLREKHFINLIINEIIETIIPVEKSMATSETEVDNVPRHLGAVIEQAADVKKLGSFPNITFRDRSSMDVLRGLGLTDSDSDAVNEELPTLPLTLPKVTKDVLESMDVLMGLGLTDSDSDVFNGEHPILPQLNANIDSSKKTDKSETKSHKRKRESSTTDLPQTLPPSLEVSKKECLGSIAATSGSNKKNDKSDINNESHKKSDISNKCHKRKLSSTDLCLALAPTLPQVTAKKCLETIDNFIGSASKTPGRSRSLKKNGERKHKSSGKGDRENTSTHQIRDCFVRLERLTQDKIANYKFIDEKKGNNAFEVDSKPKKTPLKTSLPPNTKRKVESSLKKVLSAVPSTKCVASEVKAKKKLTLPASSTVKPAGNTTKNVLLPTESACTIVNTTPKGSLPTSTIVKGKPKGLLPSSTATSVKSKPKSASTAVKSTPNGSLPSTPCAVQTIKKESLASSKPYNAPLISSTKPDKVTSKDVRVTPQKNMNLIQIQLKNDSDLDLADSRQEDKATVFIASYKIPKRPKVASSTKIGSTSTSTETSNRVVGALSSFAREGDVSDILSNDGTKAPVSTKPCTSTFRAPANIIGMPPRYLVSEDKSRSSIPPPNSLVQPLYIDCDTTPPYSCLPLKCERTPGPPGESPSSVTSEEPPPPGYELSPPPVPPAPSDIKCGLPPPRDPYSPVDMELSEENSKEGDAFFASKMINVSVTISPTSSAIACTTVREVTECSSRTTCSVTTVTASGTSDGVTPPVTSDTCLGGTGVNYITALQTISKAPTRTVTVSSGLTTPASVNTNLIVCKISADSNNTPTPVNTNLIVREISSGSKRTPFETVDLVADELALPIHNGISSTATTPTLPAVNLNAPSEKQESAKPNTPLQPTHVGGVDPPLETISIQKDEREVTVWGPPRPGYDFVSTDQQENADNFDSRWEELRNSENDIELYRKIRRRWRNLAIPNPCLNLTFRQSSYTRPLPSRPRQPQPTNRHQRSQSCVQMYEELINELRDNKNRELMELEERQNLETANLVRAAGKAERRWQNQTYNGRDNNDIFQQLNNLNQAHHRKREKLLRVRDSIIQEYTNYQDELRTFYNFYDALDPEGRQGRRTLLQEQAEHYRETERMFRRYSELYR